jgi:hypothetical protein
VCRVQLVAIRSTADRNGYILEHENIHKEADNDAFKLFSQSTGVANIFKVCIAGGSEGCGLLHPRTAG